jgi:tRNA 5-methylaminomethyl-2-thiouridine biosynthesis bifunctional protein
MAHGNTPGLWHPFAAWIKPALLVQAWLDHPRIRFHGASAVRSLQRQNQQWQLHAEDGSELGQANIVVFANAHGSAALLQRLSEALPDDFPWVADVLPKLQAMQALRGTLSMGNCPVPPLPDFPPFPVNGHGSLVSGVPTAQGSYWFAGSTFRSDAALHGDLAQEHAANLSKLQALLPAVAQALAPLFAHAQVQAWQGERCVTYDRLPLVGPLDEGDAPSLWLCAGMGARGLSFSALCAELLAAELGAEPLPLESSLARALGTRRRRRARSL